MICALHKYWLLLLLLLLLFSSVIPNGEGLLALKHFFDQHTGKEPSYETLLRLAELAPAFNFFQFGDQYFRRFYRIPIFQSIRLGPEPELYGRYCDDCIGASSSSQFFSPCFKIYLENFCPLFISLDTRVQFKVTVYALVFTTKL